MSDIDIVLDSEVFDFDHAFSVFCRFSRNESIIRFIARKRCETTLKYHLQKLAKLKIPENPRASMYNRYVQKSAKLASESVNSEIKNIFKKHDRIDREKLPENLQVLYDNIVEMYKLQRSLHEKMKLLDNDEQRAEVRNSIVELTNSIKKDWQVLDKEIESISKDESNSSTEYKESSVRSYLCKKLKSKTPLSAKVLLEMQKRVDWIKANNIILRDDTKQSLKDIGIAI